MSRKDVSTVMFEHRSNMFQHRSKIVGTCNSSQLVRYHSLSKETKKDEIHPNPQEAPVIVTGRFSRNTSAVRGCCKHAVAEHCCSICSDAEDDQSEQSSEEKTCH